MSKIYIVQDVDYEDFTIYGVYSTLERAEEAKKLYNANTIEDQELDFLPDYPKGMSAFEVEIDKNGNILGEVRQKNGAYKNKNIEWTPTQMKTVSISMWAKDKEHAIQIAQEYRKELIKTNKWTTNWKKWYEEYMMKKRLGEK